MQNRCEVCENFRPRAEFGGSYKVVEVLFDARPVHLCVGHAKIAQNSGVTSFTEYAISTAQAGVHSCRAVVPKRRKPTMSAESPVVEQAT